MMQNLQRKIVGLVMLWGLLAGAVAQQWHYKAPLPAPRGGMAAVALQGKIWVLGGRVSGHHTTNTVVVYDPATDSWSDQYPAMQVAREGATAQVFDEKIYVFGGFNMGQIIPQVEMFDPNTGYWQTIGNLPTPRTGLASVVVDSTIWLIGGGNAYHNSLNIVEIFHPHSNSWDTLNATLNIARAELMAAVINNRVYVFGGFYFGPVSSFEQYNPQTQTWEISGQIPFACASAGFTSANGWGWLIGGNGTMGPLDKVLVYRLQNNNPIWWEAPPLNTPRRNLSAVTLNDQVYAIGGRGMMQNNLYNTVEALDVITDIGPQPKNIADNYALISNYPNPFNSSSALQLYLPRADDVSIAIYDAAGRRIADIYRGHLTAGQHRFILNFNNFDGTNPASGLYFVQVTGRIFRLTHKLSLIK